MAVPVARFDDGHDGVAETVCAWLDRPDGEPLWIEPGSPWKNGHVDPLSDLDSGDLGSAADGLRDDETDAAILGFSPGF